MRVEDFQFYGILCLISGLMLLIGGGLLTFLTAERYYYPYLGTYSDWTFPYLNQGIVLGVLGVILIVISLILFREHSFRVKEKQVKPTTAPSQTQ